MLLMKVFQRKSRKASMSHRDTHTLLSDRDLGMRTELDPRLLGSSTHHRDRQLPEVSSATHVDVAGGVFLSPCSRSPSTEDTPHHTVPGGSSFLHPRAVGLPWPPDLAGLGLAAATSTVLSLHWEGTAKIQRDFSREPKHSMTLTQCKTTIREPEIWHTLKHSAMCPILMVEVSYLCWWAFGWGGWSPYLACQCHNHPVTTWGEKRENKCSSAFLTAGWATMQNLKVIPTVQSHLTRKAASSDHHPPSATTAIFLHNTIFPPAHKPRLGQAGLSWAMLGLLLGRGCSGCCSSPWSDKPQLGTVLCLPPPSFTFLLTARGGVWSSSSCATPHHALCTPSPGEHGVSTKPIQQSSRTK